MTETTVPTGRWAPIYAERLPLIASFDRLYADDFTPEDAAAVASWLEPFGQPEPTRADVEDAEVAGPHGPVPVRIYRHADGERSGAGLVWIHGGGFVNGSLDMPEADLVAKGLVTRTHAVVVSVDYRLCRDGVHHPVPHDDCWAVYEYVTGHAAELGIDPGRIAVGGASAGATSPRRSPCTAATPACFRGSRCSPTRSRTRRCPSSRPKCSARPARCRGASASSSGCAT